ncbi:MAG: hypothetical protein FWC40_00605 [Proteobacteria bacterium]|nr:hypothetical protein [Pseudomonadota bacterium]
MRKVLLGFMSALALVAAGCNDSDMSVDENGCYPYQVFCGGKCIHPQSDINYCGACDDCLGTNAGEKCQDGYSCQGGVCKSGCGKTQILCNGKCVDPKTDVNFCGASLDCQGSSAGDVCGIGESCQNGACQEVTCDAGRVFCGDTCVDPNRSAYFCGASADCQGASRGDNCNAKGMKCHLGVCIDDSGTSGGQCSAGEVYCNDATCIDPKRNMNFCGASGDCKGANMGTNCRALGMRCQSGVCVEDSSGGTQCSPGQVLCNGTCINPNTSASYCGASGDCAGANAGNKCASGQTCQSGTCKTSSSGGQTCATSCPAGQACYEGKCVPASTSTSCGIESCIGTVVNTCNNVVHCGKCGPQEMWYIQSWCTNCQNGKCRDCKTDSDCVLDGMAKGVCIYNKCYATQCKTGYRLARRDYFDYDYETVCVPQTVCNLQAFKGMCR